MKGRFLLNINLDEINQFLALYLSYFFFCEFVTPKFRSSKGVKFHNFFDMTVLLFFRMQKSKHQKRKEKQSNTHVDRIVLLSYLNQLSDVVMQDGMSLHSSVMHIIQI